MMFEQVDYKVAFFTLALFVRAGDINAANDLISNVIGAPYADKVRPLFPTDQPKQDDEIDA